MQLAGFARDGDARAELTRLDCGPVGELCPGDSGGEAEVVLDPGRRASLATSCDGIEHDGAQSLRRAVDGGGQARWTGAHHDEVDNLLLRAVCAQAGGLGQFSVAGVSQHLVVAHQHDRKRVRRDAELSDERLGDRVALDVDEPVRQSVAGREGAQPLGVR